jgi:nitrite reductase/ring-hydroxylating ferredoxin subunit
MSGHRRRYPIGQPGDIRPGAMRLVSVGGLEVGVFNLGARFVAYRNRCPHQGAPVCLGRVGGTTLPAAPGVYVFGRRDQVLHCPWHRWQFDLTTGEALVGHGVRLARVDVTVEDGQLVLHLPDRNEGPAPHAGDRSAALAEAERR